MATRRPPSPRAGCHPSTSRPARIVVGLLFAVVALVGLGAVPAEAGPAQDPGFTTATVATTTTTAPGATTTTVAGTDPDGTTTSSSESTPGTSSRILTESRKIMAIVGGLVLIALTLTLLTIRYWRQTKPVRVEPAVAARHAKAEPTRAERRAESADTGRRRSRRAVAGADHAGADDDWEPRGTGEHERVVIEPTPTGTGRPARPSRAGRAAVLRRDASSS